MERSARTYASLISEPLTYLVGFLGSSGKDLLDQHVAQLRELNNDVERLEIVDEFPAVGDSGKVNKETLKKMIAAKVNKSA